MHLCRGVSCLAGLAVRFHRAVGLASVCVALPVLGHVQVVDHLRTSPPPDARERHVCISSTSA